MDFSTAPINVTPAIILQIISQTSRRFDRESNHVESPRRELDSTEIDFRRASRVGSIP